MYDREFLAIILGLRAWKHYIQGSPHQTIVYTDHQNLTYFQNPQKLSRRQVRWVIELMEYDLKLKHKQGKQMVIADALSRRSDYFNGIEKDNENVTALPEELWIRLLDTELRDAVVLAQSKDAFAQEVLARLTDSTQSPNEWTIEESQDGSPVLFKNQRMYIPDDASIRRGIIADHHDTTVAGHPGILATTRSVHLS